MANKLNYAQIRTLSSTHIVREPEWGPRYLEGAPTEEWEDTDALFAPAVLVLYPEIPEYPGAHAYGVGYGQLMAFDSTGKDVACWEESSWHKN